MTFRNSLITASMRKLMASVPAIVLLCSVSTASAAFAGPRPAQLHLRSTPAVAYADPSNPPFTVLEEEVVVPSRLPTFGLSGRESLRFDLMVLRDEPLVQEVIGLQALLGAVGAQFGVLGSVMGSCHFAPCFALLPCKLGGDVARSVGWHTFATARAAGNRLFDAWRAPLVRDASRRAAAPFVALLVLLKLAWKSVVGASRAIVSFDERADAGWRRAASATPA